MRRTSGLRRLFPLAMALVMGMALQAPARAQKINLPPVTRTTLGNGIPVVLMEYHRAPTVTVLAEVAGGTSAEPAGKAGVAGFTARLLRKGTQARTAAQVAEQIDFLGGSLNASADLDRLTTTLGVQAGDVEAGLDLMADVLRRPLFPAEEVERTRKLYLAQLETLSEDPATVAKRVANEVAFAGHPYGVKPTIPSVSSITRDDVVAYYQSCVAPQRMTLVAVGDFKTPEMLAMLEKRFGDWPRGNLKPMDVPPAPGSPRRVVLIDKPDATQAQVRWVRVALPRSSPDYVTAQVANAILGGGFTSRLTDEIRVNRSLTYGIDSSFAAHWHGGTFAVSTFTKVETTRAMLDATDAVLRGAAMKGFTDAELQKVKGYMAGLFAIKVQTPEELASQLADVAFYRLPEDYLETYIARLQAVSLADASRVARAWFDPASLSVILVAPASKMGTQLEGLAPMERRSVDTVGK